MKNPYDLSARDVAKAQSEHDEAFSAAADTERPVSSYALMIYTMLANGEEMMDGCDTPAEAQAIDDENSRDPEVSAWVIYQKLKATTK